ncbi:CYP4V2 [Cordylochernes scorpioides]|uniref:CYP4V2 n=1 Tax=Cordylochernes scorpioides TaxID=51811 RepID=A0ABY6LE74_9ARAC|nr:CYP4V2 [Cordylochernes scorpioides]
MIMPAFNLKHLEEFVPAFDSHASTLINKFYKLCHEDYVSILPPVTLCTLDIIAGIGCGRECHGDPARCPTWQGDSVRPFHQAVIRQRKEEILQRKDEDTEDSTRLLLDLLLHFHIHEKSLTEDDIREEVDTFMFATDVDVQGHDTSALGIGWALYNIGLYPEIQARLHEEIDAIFQGDLLRPVTPEDVKEMKYLECVLKVNVPSCVTPVSNLLMSRSPNDSTQLFPSSAASQTASCKSRHIEREREREYIFTRCITHVVPGHGGYTLPKGCTCFLFTYMLHRNPEVYPEPEKFDPDRFLPENCLSRHPFAYLPFSAGPRNCLGQKFAMLEMKTVVANILRNFTWETLDPPDRIHLVAELVLRPVEELRLRMRPRQTPPS